MSQDKTTVNDLADSIKLVKEDVNALRIAAAGQKAQWYKTLSTWISILALLLSFGTAYFSYTRARTQDIQNTRAELRGLLQRLVALPTQLYEASKKYERRSRHVGSVSGAKYV